MKYWVGWVSKISAYFAAYLFFTIGLIIAYEVSARYLFNMPTIWVEEVSRLLQLWGCYLSMAWILRERKLIRITILLQKLSGIYLKIAESISILIIAIFSAITIYYASSVTLDSIALDRHTSSMLGLPAWLFEASVVFGFILLLVQCIVELINLYHQTEIEIKMEHDI